MNQIDTLYELLKDKIENTLEIVDDIEYYNEFIYGIVIYFPTGECFQIFINKNNDYEAIDENLCIFSMTKDINIFIDNIVRQTKRKNYNLSSTKFMHI